MSTPMSTPLTRSMADRGVATRDALLDAAEAMISDYGFNEPSHRTIAGAAGVHAALLNYHFGSKESLFEAAVARRANRLNKEWRVALADLQSRDHWEVQDVLRAWWRPFQALRRDDDDVPWRNYVCVIARLASAHDGDTWHQRYFAEVDTEFVQMLADALPGRDRTDIEASFRYSRALFSETLLYRCGKSGGSCAPLGFREDDLDRMIRYLAHGMRGMGRPESAT